MITRGEPLSCTGMYVLYTCTCMCGCVVYLHRNGVNSYCKLTGSDSDRKLVQTSLIFPISPPKYIRSCCTHTLLQSIPFLSSIHSRGVHLSCASLLIQGGADLDKQASDGSTAIHLASAVGAISLIEFALLNHADPDIRDFEGRLPLHWVTLSSHSSKCAALLLKVAS